MLAMTAEEAAEWGKTLDFPTVWAALMESRARSEKLDEKFEKLMEKMDRESAEAMERFNRTNAEATEKFNRANAEAIERFNKQSERLDRITTDVGGLHNSMGDLIETLFMPHLGEKFDSYGYNLKRMFRRVPIYDDDNRVRSDIDILLSNTTVCMAVEVKRWLETTDHVDRHIKRMQLIRQYPPAEVKGKKLLGAIVGAAVTPEAREYAEQSGFFVLEFSGEDVRLLEPPKGFQPKEW